jgi:hypothetical protein
MLGTWTIDELLRLQPGIIEEEPWRSLPVGNAELSLSLAPRTISLKCPWYENTAKTGQCTFPSTAVLILGASAILAMIVMTRS